MIGTARARALVLLAVLALVGSACAQVPRGVGSQPAKLVLTFANGLDQHRELQAIADTVERLSAGSMQIEFDDYVHRDRPDTESAIIDDVVAGRYDMAWVPQRPWPERGIHAFDALVAPLLIDTYPLEGAVLADPIVDEMLAALDGSGVVGLGIVPGPIRYAATRSEPALDLESLKGMTVAIDDTAVAEDALETLGAKATKKMTLGGADLSGADAVIQQLGSIAGNRYDLEMPHVTGLGLWPRPVIVIIGKPRFDALSSDQRAWLAQAVDAAVADQLAALPTADVQAIEHMCENGTTFASPTADQRAAFAAAIEPVYERLGTDPFTARAVTRIQELKASTAPAGALPPCDLGSKAAPSTAAGVGFPDGTYAMDASCEELQAFWESNQTPVEFRGECPGHGEFTLKDGKWTEWYGERWTYAFVGDHVKLGDFTLRWTYDGKQVTFSEIEGGRPDDAVVWTIKPYARVDDPAPTPVAGFPEGRYVAEVSAEEQQAAWERFDVPLNEREVCPCRHEFTLADGQWTGADGHRFEHSFSGDHVTISDDLMNMTVRWTYDPRRGS